MVSLPHVCASMRAGVSICTLYLSDVRAPISPSSASAVESVSILSACMFVHNNNDNEAVRCA
jgi:hypothetical protein